MELINEYENSLHYPLLLCEIATSCKPPVLTCLFQEFHYFVSYGRINILCCFPIEECIIKCLSARYTYLFRSTCFYLFIHDFFFYKPEKGVKAHVRVQFSYINFIKKLFFPPPSPIAGTNILFYLHRYSTL